MVKVSMLEFRKNADKVIKRARRGERTVLTYRGNPVIRLEPIKQTRITGDDPFYTLDELSESKADNLKNKDIDRIIYER